ncbi:MAG TPA: glycosyltransferase family 2 protein [Stellaceae bacterium]|nr:glycosyltransferase family 2 protein [Stellaceae bacterium]
MDLSVIIPVHDEAESIAPLHQELAAVLGPLGRGYEIIFVDDGSRDGTLAVASEIAARDRSVKVVQLLRNYGQTAAMMAGIDYAQGAVIVAMDGDGQNDPADIPRLLAELEKGYDVVSGWRTERKDRTLTRRLPSFFANRIISAISGVRLHDYGCSLKAYRREVIKSVRLYGEMHRFIPIYTTWFGGRIAELPVNHRPRLGGRSKYGLGRTFKVLLDIAVVRFLDRYLTKPIYIFGGFGLLCMFAGTLAGAYMLWLKFGEGFSFILTPLPVVVTMLFVTGVLALLMGLLAELMVRTYFESQDKRVYAVKTLINIE